MLRLNFLPLLIILTRQLLIENEPVLTPRKSLGQHFLKDENILRNIVKQLNVQDGDVVVEIGPGQGALTKYLLDKKIKLIGIEIDKNIVNFLKDYFGYNAILINDDVLNVNLVELSKEHAKSLRIVGNIPYYLTSEILFWMFDAYYVLEDAHIMMQYEVAKRLIAKPRSKEYGILSVFSQFYSDCELVFKVSKNCFFPKPRVDSAFVRMVFKKQLPQCDKALFRKVVRSTFGKRRKTLWNGLRAMGYGVEQLSSINFSFEKRPEELSPMEFVELVESLKSFETEKELS